MWPFRKTRKLPALILSKKMPEVSDLQAYENMIRQFGLSVDNFENHLRYQLVQALDYTFIRHFDSEGETMFLAIFTLEGKFVRYVK